MTTPAILGYNRTGDIVTSDTGKSLLVDWANNVLYVTFAGTGTAGGIAKFSADPTSDTELLEHNCTDIGITALEQALFTGQPVGITYNGYIVCTDSPANWPAYHIITASSLSIFGTFSTNRSTGAPGATQIGNPQNMAPIRFGSSPPTDFMCITAARTVNVLPIPSPGASGNIYLGQVDEHQAYVGPGDASGGAIGTAFVLGATVSGTSTPLGIYKIRAQNSGVTWAKIGTVSPTQIDATWSTIFQSGGCGYDLADGHIIIIVNTSDSVTHKTYYVKLSSIDASVMWTIPVPFMDGREVSNLPRSRINGTLLWMQAGNFYTIDTIAGTATSTTYGTLTVTNNQVSDSTSGTIFLKGTWLETTTHPTYLGSYMGPPGNHTTINPKAWMRFLPGGVPPISFTLPRATATGHARAFTTLSPQPPPLPMEIPVIPSYLYQEYNDDDDLQAFVAAYNTVAQAFSDWFTSLHIPIYTSDPISGDLLDWVAKGVYGMARPALGTGRFTGLLGPLNTYQYNVLAPNQMKRLGSSQSVAVDDDVFRRVLTWHIEKVYGKVFNLKWLKFRIVQFLTGINGIPLQIDNTYMVSVTFGANHVVNINFPKVKVTGVSGFILNTTQFNQRYPNEIHVQSTPVLPVDNVALLRAAIESGALELPFQYTYIVNG